MAFQRRHSTLPVSQSSRPQLILSQMQGLGYDLAQHRPGAREQLLNLSHALISSLELPSEAIQRMGWAEVQLLPFLAHHPPLTTNSSCPTSPPAPPISA
jgi:hypothetical protein